MGGQTEFLLIAPAEVGVVSESHLIGNPGNRHFRAGKEGLSLFQPEFFQIRADSHAQILIALQIEFASVDSQRVRDVLDLHGLAQVRQKIRRKH